MRNWPDLAILTAALVAIAHGEAAAGACGRTLDLIASGPTLARGDVVLLEVSEDPDAVARALPTARFVAGTASAPARVVQVIRGGRLQALLALDGELPSGSAVHLAVGVPALDDELATRQLGTVAAAAARGVPRWHRRPRVGARHRVPGHKGDSADTYAIRVRVDDAPFVLATISGADATAEVLYPVTGGAIELGTTGCNNMWWPRGARTVTVALRAVGPTGAASPAPGPALRLRF